MTRLFGFSIDHPRRVLFLAALLALACAPGLLLLESDNTPHVFYRGGSAEAREYARFRERFGADEALRLVLRGPALATPEGLRFVGELERDAALLPGVEAVGGLASASSSWPPSAAEQRALLADPLWRELGVVAEDGRLISVLLALEPQTAREQAALLGAAERLLARHPAGVTVEVVGMAALNRALDAASHDVEWRYFPLLVLLSVLLLAAALRRATAVVLPLVFVLLSELALFGPMGYAGVRLNMVLAVLAPLVLVIALATALYVQVRFNDARRAGIAGEAAVRDAYAAKRRPLIWTSVTTIVGFGALLLSHLGPVRALGFWCVVSTLEMVVFVFTVYPALLVVFPGPATNGGRRSAEAALQALGRRSAHWGIRHRRAVVACALLLGLVGLAGFPRLRVGSFRCIFWESFGRWGLAAIIKPRGDTQRSRVDALLRVVERGGSPFSPSVCVKCRA